MCISVVEMLVGLWNWCRRFRRNVSARNVDPHVFACAKMPVSTGEDDSSKRVDESSSPVETCRRRRFQNNFLHTICLVAVDVAVEIHIKCFCISLYVKSFYIIVLFPKRHHVMALLDVKAFYIDWPGWPSCYYAT